MVLLIHILLFKFQHTTEFFFTKSLQQQLHLGKWTQANLEFKIKITRMSILGMDLTELLEILCNRKIYDKYILKVDEEKLDLEHVALFGRTLQNF